MNPRPGVYLDKAGNTGRRKSGDACTAARGVRRGRRHTGGNIDLIPSYVAARSRTGPLVRLDLDNGWETTSWAWEYYDYRKVGWERTNSYADPEYADEVAVLRGAIRRFDNCASFRRDEAVPPPCR